MVELSLSLIFISILSLAVVMVIMNAVSSYHRSIILNQIDQVGTSLVDDMRSSIMASPPSRLSFLCGDDKKCNPMNYILVTRTGRVQLKNGNWLFDGEIALSGALCTGTNSYIWNSGYYYSDEYQITQSKAKANDDDNFRLLKVVDRSRDVCKKYDSNSGKFTLPEDGESKELLKGEGGLALYDLVTSVADQEELGKSVYYYTSFILGTIQGGINVKAENCAAPEASAETGVEGNLDYCAINKFNFAALATGRKE